jgi:DHA1 family multidrug resistance protein-like MFS transporter
MKLETWEKNLYAVWVAQFLALMGANLVFPFIPFFVADLGIEDKDKQALWTGVTSAATGAMLFISSPIWGSLADRFGRKNMLLRAYAGATVTITAQAFVQSVWQLFFLRAIQGAFVGTIPAATAHVAGGTPQRRMAYALGMVQMAIFTSQTVGPVAGGIMAGAFGRRPTFAIGGLMYIVSFVLCWLFVKEDFRRPDPADRTPYSENLRAVLRTPAMPLLILVMFLVSSAAIFVRPVVPLVVESFTDSSVDTKSGLVFAAVAVTSAAAAVLSGRFAARGGYRYAHIVATFGAGLAYALVFFANSLGPLMLTMALVGVFSGAMIPMVNALIGAAAPEGKHGSAFGLVGSAQALSLAVAPLAGGITADALGIHAGFPLIGAMLAAVAALVWLTVREPASLRGGDDAAVTPVVESAEAPAQ